MRALLSTTFAAGLALAGCESVPGAGEGRGDAPAAPAAGTGAVSRGAPISDECTVYHRTMAGKTSAEQQATMRAQMRSMSGRDVTSEQVRIERQRLDRACGPAPAGR
jgi:hypothetical protein